MAFIEFKNIFRNKRGPIYALWNSVKTELQALSEGLVTFPITPEVGSDLELQAVTGKDIKFKLTDAAGARKVSVHDSADAEVGSIDSNGVFTSAGGFVGALTGNVTGDVTKGSTDLAITAASAKDIIVKMGDASGAKKVSFIDSADAEQASLDSDGLFTAKKLKGNLPIATAAAAPSEAGMISAFGAIAASAGLLGVYIDSTAEAGSTYLITCDGVKYYATDLASDVLS
jgi:hypothetical protein